MSRIRIVPTIVAMLVTLVLLFGGWIAYRNFGLVHPVEQELMSISNVEQVNVTVSTQNRVVKIKLSQVKDLQTTFHSIRNVVTQSLGNDTQIEVLDNRNEDLTELYQSLQPILFEGLHKGTYSEMIQAITNRSKQAGVNARVTMDMNNLYIQLSKDQNYLYDIVPYSNSQKQGVNPS
jgi:hypothetical protein